MENQISDVSMSSNFEFDESVKNAIDEYLRSHDFNDDLSGDAKLEERREKASSDIKKLESNESIVKYLIESDVSNTKSSFYLNYERWANTNLKGKVTLRLSSIFRTTIMSFIYPAKWLGMPFYFFYTNQDKMLSAPFHYHAASMSKHSIVKNHLYVSRFSYEYRRELTKKVSVAILCIGLSISFIVHGTKAIDHLITSSKDAYYRYERSKEQLALNKDKFEQKRNSIKEKALLATEEYTSGKLSKEAYEKVKIYLKDQDEQLQNEYELVVDAIKKQ